MGIVKVSNALSEGSVEILREMTEENVGNGGKLYAECIVRDIVVDTVRAKGEVEYMFEEQIGALCLSW